MKCFAVALVVLLPAGLAFSQRGEGPSGGRARISRPRAPALTIEWNDGAAVLEHTSQRTPDGTHERRRELLSAVGPMTSIRRYETVPGGTGRRVTAELEVLFHGGYRFDLDTFLGQTGRSGQVAADVVDMLVREPLPTVQVDSANCPSRGRLEASEGSLDYLLGRLVGSGCLRRTAGVAGGGDVFARRVGPRGFAIASYDQDADRVALDIEIASCIGAPTVCEVRTVRSHLEPPAAWGPWLEAALAGRGLFAEGQLWRIAGLSARDAMAMHRAVGESLESMDGHSALVVARPTAPPEVTVGGYDGQLQLELRLRVVAVLAPGRPGEGPDVGDVVTAHPSEGVAELGESLRGLDEGAPAAAVRRAFPRLWRRGDHLVVLGPWVERQRRSVVVPISARSSRFLRRLFAHPIRDPRRPFEPL